MCFPDFDSPTIFAALLDSEKGGRFQIVPSFTAMKTKQLYLPDINVLLTRFLSKDGVGEITDFMPVEELFEGTELIRRVTTVRGNVHYKIFCQPRFNYGMSSHSVKVNSDFEVEFASDDGKTRLRLISTIPLKVLNNDVMAEFTLSSNQTADFLLEHIEGDHQKKEITEPL